MQKESCRKKNVLYLFTCKRYFNAILIFIVISVLNSFHVLSTKLLHNPSLINMDYGAVRKTQETLRF